MGFFFFKFCPLKFKKMIFFFDFDLSSHQPIYDKKQTLLYLIKYKSRIYPKPAFSKLFQLGTGIFCNLFAITILIDMTKYDLWVTLITSGKKNRGYNKNSLNFKAKKCYILNYHFLWCPQTFWSKGCPFK